MEKFGTRMDGMNNEKGAGSKELALFYFLCDHRRHTMINKK